jgi:hypothetical protein
VASGSTSITLSWKVGENDGGRPVEKIIIQYRAYNDTEWQSETIYTDPRKVRYTIENLKSNTRYMLRVIAVNDIAPSQPSITHLEKTRIDTDINIQGTNISRFYCESFVKLTTKIFFQQLC